MKLLRKTIRKLILEAYVSPEAAAANPELMVFMDVPSFSQIEKKDDRHFFIMKKPSRADEAELIRLANRANEIDVAIGQWLANRLILAELSTEKPDDPCNGALAVQSAAAEGGMGPTIYDLVMSWADKGLMSDRDSVSPSAKHVWDTYCQERDDVEKWALDNVRAPFTTTPLDDCEPADDYEQPFWIDKDDEEERYEHWTDFSGNWSFNLPESSAFKTLVNRCEDWIDNLSDGIKPFFKRRHIRKSIAAEASSHFFSERFI